MPRALALLLCSCWLAAGCEPPGVRDCEDRNCLLRAENDSPVRSLDFWQDYLGKPLARRVGRIPDELLDYLYIDNKLHGYSGEPESSDDARIMQVLQQAFKSLPAAVLQLVEGKLIGIFPVRNLGASGYIEGVKNSAGEIVGGVIVLDLLQPGTKG